MALSPDESIERPPISAAQFFQRGVSCGRALLGREHNAPMGCGKASCRTRRIIRTHAPLQSKNRAQIKPASSAHTQVNLFSNKASLEGCEARTRSIATVYSSRRSSADNRRKLVGVTVTRLRPASAWQGGRRLQKRFGNGIRQFFAFSS
jgi:hypothetical protein